ncbi:hypothetical protein [Streptomyces sp. ID05-47C]|uniref:hypothetical protein n=1 Tax=Streptomyces sp. ID05-47C TaxID=3028665 RepID=UPI0029B7DD1D|nr:hypothetical protein [Streptomyces sp. ID05-47C]MDX3567948.1 hypothetical protein [Streptomyces sp. ID05-47C]
MERTKRALALLLGLATRRLDRRTRRRPADGAGDTAREILNQPPRPVRGDDGPATTPTPRW